MIDVVGSFSLIWLGSWFVLTSALMAAYPLLRGVLMRLHPRHGTAVMLIYAAAPCLLSLTATVLLFLPSVQSLLVQPHCHADCASHVPLVAAPAAAAVGTGLALVVLLVLAGRFLYTLAAGWRMRRQFDLLSQPRRGYRSLESDVPMVFTLGWIQPRVYISTALRRRCDAAMLGVILRHEQAHRRRRDSLRLAAARLFCLGLPGPLAGRFIADLQLLSEQACDFEAAERFGSLRVADTLLQIKRLLMRFGCPPRAGEAFTGAEVRWRVAALLDSDERVRLTRWHQAVLALLVVSALLLAVEPLHHGAEWVIGSMWPFAGQLWQ